MAPDTDLTPRSWTVHPGRTAALAGVIATAAGLALAEGVAALTPLVPSPLDTLGQLVVTALPGAIVTGAIAVLGAANRAVLAILSVLVALGLGAGVAALARRSLPGAVSAVTAVALGTALAMLSRPDAAFPLVLLTLVAAAGLTLALLHRLLAMAALLPLPPGAALPSPTDPPVDRRAFLRLGVGTSVTALAVGGAARTGGGAGAAVPATTPAPTAGNPLPPVPTTQDLATQLDGVSPVLTPNDRFFRIDTAIVLPRVDVDDWELTIAGEVEQERRYRYADLAERELVEVDATIACVSNEVGGSLIGTARWVGVPLHELLAEAGPTAGAEQVLGRSVDGFTAGFPIEVVGDGSDALVALGMNGEPLPLEHGYPARLVVPGLFGYVSATKWLSSIELTAWDGVDGYWVPRGWAKRGPVKTSSRIDVPETGADVAAGGVVVAGVAWAPTRGIEVVEVVVDGDEVVSAELTSPLSGSTWVQWRAEVVLDAGDHELAVRATDGTGEVQSAIPTPPAPAGAEGWHTIRVRAG